MFFELSNVQNRNYYKWTFIILLKFVLRDSRKRGIF